MWYKNKPLHRGSHCHCQPSSLWRNSLQRFKNFEVLFFLLCRRSRLSLIELTMLCIFFMSVGWSPIFSSPPVFFNIPRGYSMVNKCERTAHKKALFFSHGAKGAGRPRYHSEGRTCKPVNETLTPRGKDFFLVFTTEFKLFNPLQPIELDSSELH